MKEAYASLASYSDSGIVRTYRIPLTPHEITFTTSYVRPGLFKFAWVMPHPYPPLSYIKWRSAIWSNDSGAYIWWDIEKEKGPSRVDDLRMAVAGATGVSMGSAPN